MFRKIFLVLAALAALLALGLGAVLAVAAMQPSDYRVERSAAVAAPPMPVFQLVNDFNNWEGWSPWAKLDPDAKVKFTGPAWGPGAAFAWDGNARVGAGKMTIADSRPADYVRIRLEFTRPFADTATAEFTFKPAPAPGGTVVTWAMFGARTSLIAKAVCLFMDMDKILGAEFDKGLAAMKSIAEAEEKARKK